MKVLPVVCCPEHMFMLMLLMRKRICLSQIKIDDLVYVFAKRVSSAQVPQADHSMLKLEILK